MINRQETRTSQPNARQAGPWTSGFLVAFALIGLYCSAQLLLSELKLLTDPAAELACDINPLIGCSTSLLSPQAHLIYELPNAAVGLFLFGMLLALAAVLAAGGSLPRLVWIGMVIGLVLGAAYVVFFLVESVTVFRALCPYCMGVWAAILGALPTVVGSAARVGALGNGAKRWGRAVTQYSWAVVLVLYLLVVLTIVITLSDKVGMLFN